jgi:hypothetical protein
MSVFQVVAPAQSVSATASTGTATFAACTTNVFQIDNTNATVFAYVNAFTTNSASANGFNHPNNAGQTGKSLVIPPNQSRILVGDFAVTGGGQSVFVNHMTAASSATVIITPISVQRNITL